MIRYVRLLAILAALCLSTPTVLHAAGLRTATRDGYARLVFDWDSPVRYSADVVGGQLVMQFETPIGGNIAAANQALAEYVTGPGQLSPDGRTLIFPLRPSVTMRTFPVGNAVVVDLTAPTPPPVAAAAKPTPPAAAKTPATAPAQTVAKTSPVVNTDQALALQGSLSSTVGVRAAAHPDFFRVALDWPGKTNYKVERGDDKVTVTFDRAAPINLDTLNRNLPAALRPATVAVDNGHTILTFPVAADGQFHDFSTANTIAFDLVPGSKVAKSEPSPTKDSAKASAKNAVADKGKKELAAAADKSSKPTAKHSTPTETAAAPADNAGQVSLTIPWTEPTAVAVFRRAEFTWVVFDRYQQLDVDKLQKAGAPYITFIEQLPFRNNTILRMVTPPDINPSVRRDGLSWILDFRAMPIRPTRPIDIRPQVKGQETSLFAAVSEGGRTVGVEDPEVGDMLLVVPVIPLSEGVYPDRSFPDLDLPTTAQGILVVPKSDGVRAQASQTGVDIEVDGGMVLSKALVDSGETVSPQANANANFNIADWQVGHPEEYIKTKQALEAATSDERPEIKQAARLRFARFEFVNGFYPEALGVLRVMRDADSDIEETAPFRAVRGATELMMRRWPEASDDLNHLSLASDDDAHFWLAAARAQIGHPEAQAQAMIQSGGVIRDYPSKVKITLALIALDAAIASGDEFGARGFLDILRKETADATQQPMIDYLDGKLNQKFGDLQVALQDYRKAEAGANFYYSVLANRDRLELEHQLGTISTADLIEGFEKLRYRWRGDDVELGLLLRLGDLYTDQGDYGTALRTLKLTTEYFQDDPRVDEAAIKMSGLFEKLYLDDESAKMQPVEAIGLFDEFRSLVPPGDKGDEMIRKLADRLVSVDLLDQAAVLLERQVQFRVTGVDRARIGARLALVYLLNREPQKAVDILHDTEEADTGHDLNSQRRRLEARALTDLGKIDQAILMLGADTSLESRQLRAEIYWRSQDWGNAAKAIAEMVPEADAGALSEPDAKLVLDWATALTLANDDRTVSRVHQRYGGLMANTPYKDAFALITTPKEKGVMDVKSVKSQIEQAENFKSFMVEYKDMLGQKPLSAIN
ncbi:MAG: tetratricopeptide repeat protein [Rhodospirillaceae bacterium]|nr:MAG: tetratricopeptide repeat protein [Rhodospirillaceae bacterium]